MKSFRESTHWITKEGYHLNFCAGCGSDVFGNTESQYKSEVKKHNC